MRFYGGQDPSVWLEQVPAPIVQACITMLPRLQAEESLRMVTEIGTSFGGDAATTQAREWAGHTKGIFNAEQQAPKPRDLTLTSRVGITFTKVRRKKAG